MSAIISREGEQKTLESAYQSTHPEFLAIYGRRRVGKTYLVRNHFAEKKSVLFFYATGTKSGTLLEQITNFTEAIGDAFLYPGARLEISKNWRDTFRTLTNNIRATPPKRKIVLFFDEFPWMVTQNSRLLQTLEYYWNHHWAQDSRIKLIICGSSSSWILKHIVNNQGGLYNRVTRVLHLEPFDLCQTKKYLSHAKIRLNLQQIAHLYMVLGGIPYYLSQVPSGLSAKQVVSTLAFRKDAFLLREFKNLYATLFEEFDTHIELVRNIAKHPDGIAQEVLLNATRGISSGGRVISWLEALELAGFIARFRPFFHSRKGVYYKVIDEYSLFYFHWIEPKQSTLFERGMGTEYWEKIQNSPAWYTWAGHAFEAICYRHIEGIRKALNIPSAAIPYTWRYAPMRGTEDKGAQIDLLFDRDDNTITICEIKYTEQPFVIDKSYAETLRQKVDAFKKVTRTRKNILIAMVSANGLKKTLYSEEVIDGVVVLEDLFKSND